MDLQGASALIPRRSWLCSLLKVETSFFGGKRCVRVCKLFAQTLGQKPVIHNQFVHFQDIAILRDPAACAREGEKQGADRTCSKQYLHSAYCSQSPRELEHPNVIFNYSKYIAILLNRWNFRATCNN